ncbi:MAG: hypothetical protein IJS87_03955 [Rhodocyclaceae bacterium]|nr:hypothetical protein [Rhodocyclaceae bacterium]
MMLTYEEAKARLFDCLQEELHILKAWETDDAFIFSACDMGEKEPYFDIPLYEVLKGYDDLPPPVDLYSPEEFDFARIEHARRIV